MIAVDASPLVHGPRSVAQVLRGLLLGWPAEAPELCCMLPGWVRGAAGGDVPSSPLPANVSVASVPQARTPRALRRALPGRLAALGARGLLLPWAAVPRGLDPGVAVAALVHEVPFATHGPLEGRLRTWRHARALARAARTCAALVVPTRAVREDLLRLHPAAAARVHVIPNPFDPRPWEAARAAPAERPYAVMVGLGLGAGGPRKKGLDVVLAAWRRGLVPEHLGLVLVGDAPRRLPRGVEARGVLDDAALRALVARAALLLYPSRSEGFGYPPLEALAAGVAVVASDLPAVAEVAGGGAWRVPPGDAAALAAGVRRVLGDAALAASLRREGAVRARAFAPEACAAAWWTLFAALGAGA